MLIIRFLGFIKFQYNKSNDRNHIFIRGQVNDHENMFPAIFRGKELNEDRIQKRLDAFEEIKCRINIGNSPRRFSGEIGGAALQHYGLKTPWLDLVDNIFIGCGLQEIT